MAFLESTLQDLGIVTVDEAEPHLTDEETVIETEEAQVFFYDASSSPVHISAVAEVPVEDFTACNESRVRKKAATIIDQVERVIERFRLEALRLEEEKEAILSSLDSLKHSDELFSLPGGESTILKHDIDAMIGRMQTVEIRIYTHRSRLEEEALYRVNGYIDELVLKLQEDPGATEATCSSFLRACDGITDGHRDIYFESAISECCRDDRKRIRKRLQGLMDYISSWQKNVQFELLE